MPLESLNGHDSGTEFSLDQSIAPTSYAPPAAASTQSAPAAPASGAPASASPSPAQADASSTPAPTAQAAPASSSTVAGSGQPAPVSSPVRDYLRQQGINADHFHDDQAALNFLLGQLRTSAQQIDEMRYWAGLGQAAYAAQQHGAPEPAAQTAPQAPGAPQEPAWKKLWQVPEWREEWANDVHWNPQTGRFEPNHQYVHPKIVQAANERQAWKKQALDKLLNNPFDLVWEGTQDRIQQLLEEREQQILEKVAQIFQNRQQDQFVIETVNQNASWMYERDANGNLIMDPHPSGQAFPRLSQHGRRYAECIMWLKKQGIVDPQAQHEGAMRMMGSMLAGAPQQAPQAPGAPQQNTAAQERRDRFLNRAAGAAAMGPSQTGTMTDWNNVASPPQNTRLDFGAMLDQTMAERGLIPATG